MIRSFAALCGCVHSVKGYTRLMRYGFWQTTSCSHTCEQRFCAHCRVESSRFRRQRRARIFEIVSQSLTIAPNVHPSGTSSTSSPATTCWRCQTHPELSRGMAVTPREDRYSSCTVLSTAISLLVSALIKPARFHRDSSLA